MEREPALYIGKQPWYIGRFWKDRATGAEIENKGTEEDLNRQREKTVILARGFNYFPKKKQEAHF